MEIPTVELKPLSTSTSSIAAILIGTVFLTWVYFVLEWVWFGPKKLERQLRQQGLAVLPYRVFHGDLRDIRRMGDEASSAPMTDFSHDHIPRIRPFLHRAFAENGGGGDVCVTWEGPEAVMNVREAGLVKEVLLRHDEFRKPKPNPLTGMLARGLISYDGDKWALHRRLINPAFHIHKLKLMMPAFYTSCGETLSLWEKKVSNGEHEIDVCGDLRSLSADAISRAAFGSSHEEGRRIFQLITHHILVTITIAQSVYFPGRRCTNIIRHRREISTTIGLVSLTQFELPMGQSKHVPGMFKLFFTLDINIKGFEYFGQDDGKREWS